MAGGGLGGLGGALRPSMAQRPGKSGKTRAFVSPNNSLTSGAPTVVSGALVSEVNETGGGGSTGTSARRRKRKPMPQHTDPTLMSPGQMTFAGNCEDARSPHGRFAACCLCYAGHAWNYAPSASISLSSL